jgi:hypothetical protein
MKDNNTTNLNKGIVALAVLALFAGASVGGVT